MEDIDDDLFGHESDDGGSVGACSDDGTGDSCGEGSCGDDASDAGASCSASCGVSDAGVRTQTVSAERKHKLALAAAAKQKAAVKATMKRVEKLAASARLVTRAEEKAAIAARVQFRASRSPQSPPPRTPPPHKHQALPPGGQPTGAQPPGAQPGAQTGAQTGAQKEPRAYDRYKRPEPVRERDRVPCLVMAKPVGFDSDPFEARISQSTAKEFSVTRVVHTLKNRFAPFSSTNGRGGASLFYTDTTRFYSEPTELCCLWCTEPINGVPIPMPVRYRANRTDRDDWIFYVAGQYCNFACMLAAYRQRPIAHTSNRSDQLARTLMWKSYGVPFTAEVHPAPDPASLAKFGGIYTTEQFRATGMTGVRSSVVALPFLPFSAGITEIESIDVTITEVGGQELARRRVRGGFASAGLANPILNTQPRNAQRGKFATAPSIREQIDASDRRMRLQMSTLPQDKKKKTLLDFMQRKKE